MRIADPKVSHPFARMGRVTSIARFAEHPPATLPGRSRSELVIKTLHPHGQRPDFEQTTYRFEPKTVTKQDIARGYGAVGWDKLPPSTPKLLETFLFPLVRGLGSMLT